MRANTFKHLTVVYTLLLTLTYYTLLYFTV